MARHAPPFPARALPPPTSIVDVDVGFEGDPEALHNVL